MENLPFQQGMSWAYQMTSMPMRLPWNLRQVLCIYHLIHSWFDFHFSELCIWPVRIYNDCPVFFYCLINNFFLQFASIFSLNIHETHRSCFKTNRFSASFDNDFAFVTQWHCNITIDFDDLFVARTTIFNLNYFCLVSILHF